jgi:hypothetical protein
MIFTYYFNYIMFDDNKYEELNKYLYTLLHHVPHQPKIKNIKIIILSY